MTMYITIADDGHGTSVDRPQPVTIGHGSRQRRVPHIPRVVVWHRQTTTADSIRAAEQRDRVAAWLAADTPIIGILRDDATGEAVGNSRPGKAVR